MVVIADDHTIVVVGINDRVDGVPTSPGHGVGNLLLEEAPCLDPAANDAMGVMRHVSGRNASTIASMSQASNNQLTRLMKSIALTLSTGLSSANDGALAGDICGRRDPVSVLDAWDMTCIVETSVSQCEFTLLSPVRRRLLLLPGCVSAPTSRGRRCRPGELCC